MQSLPAHSSWGRAPVSDASADRLTKMTAPELSVYKAKLAVAAYFYFLQGKPRGEVAIHWHGDETQHEMEFVNRTLDEAFTSAERDRRERPSERIPEQLFGDRAYRACMSADQDVNGGWSSASPLRMPACPSGARRLHAAARWQGCAHPRIIAAHMD